MLIRRGHKTTKTVVPVVVMRRWRRAAIGLLFLTTLFAAIALYCRAEWLQAARDRNAQRDLAYAAEVSAEYWFQKYYVRERSRPGARKRDVAKEMLARQRELAQKAGNVAGK